MEWESQSEMNIFHLPVEILFKIMKLAGFCSTSNDDIRFVCKHFYETYSSFTSCCVIFDSTEIRHDVVDSMMHSLRRPSTFMIANLEDSSKVSTLKEIVKHFAVHVRILQFELQKDSKMKLADFEFILRSMINVEEVTFNGLRIDGHPNQLANVRIQMPMLRKIVLVDCDAESTDAILCMEAGLLEEFCVRGRRTSDFTKFFKKHKTVKSIAMSMSRWSGSGELPNLSGTEHLQLCSLQLYNNGQFSALHNVIASQPMLKHLNLLTDEYEIPYELYYFDDDDDDEDVKMTVDDEAFTALCKSKKLESLKIVLGQVQPDTMEKIAGLTELKELVVLAAGEYFDYDNDYDYDVKKMCNDVLFQKCFQKLIASPLPKLESLTWSQKNFELYYDYLTSEQKAMMDHARQREYSSLAKVNIMASSFPLLKYLKIEMISSDVINVCDILKRFPHLQTLQLATSSTFKGERKPMHEKIKDIKISKIERSVFIDMLRSMPNLESLHIKNTEFPLNNVFLQNFQAAVPCHLKKLRLEFTSAIPDDFTVENIAILHNVIKKLQTCDVTLTGNCDFDSLAETLDRSDLASSPKWYRAYSAYSSFMQLHK